MRRFGLLLRKIILLVLVLAFLGAAGYGVWRWRSGGGDPVRFRTETVSRGRIASLINASGTVVPEEVVDVGAQVAGKIKDFGEDLDVSGKSIDYGSRVKAGTLLAVIDKSLYQADANSAEADVASADADLAVAAADVKKSDADLDAARAKATQASKDFERARRSGSGSVSPVEYDALQAANTTAKAAVPAALAAVEKSKKMVLRAEAGKNRAKAAYERASTNLAYCDIRSPVDGVIIDRRVNKGQTVVASLNAPSLFLIAKDLKKMQVWASVSEADIGRIHVGQNCYFRVDAFPNEVFTGVVGQIRFNATNTQNVVTYTVVVNTDNSNLKLLPYLTANLQFHVEHRDDVLMVPNAALRYRPALERVAPEYQEWYQSTRKRRASTNELKPGKAADKRGVLWVQDEEGDLRPVKVRTGLSDGVVTEIVAVLEGSLEEDTAVISGELQARAEGGNNPFAVKLWGKRKKKE